LQCRSEHRRICNSAEATKHENENPNLKRDFYQKIMDDLIRLAAFNWVKDQVQIQGEVLLNFAIFTKKLL
jgi:hypothetical protein